MVFWLDGQTYILDKLGYVHDNKRFRVHNTKSIRVNTIEYFQSGTGLFLFFFIFFWGYYEYPIHKIKNLTFFGFFKYFLFQNHNYKHVQTNTYDAITQVFKSSYTGQTWTLLILTILTMHKINITVCFFISNGQHKVETQHNLISQLKNTHKILY